MIDGQQQILLDLIEVISASKNCDGAINAINLHIEKYYSVKALSIVIAPFDRPRRRIFSSTDPALGRLWLEVADENPNGTVAFEIMKKRHFSLFPWGSGIGLLYIKDERLLEFFEEIDASGFKSNFFIPFWGGSPDDHAIVSLYSSLSARELSGLAWEHGADLISIATALAMRVSAGLEAERRQEAPILTNREIESLHWLASGLRLDIIACRLGISEWTVSFHLKNARDKLGARTNEQALVKALTFGLIHP
ncbi:response regulator transcription factor [Telmatospirillum siberiense]|nr:helix-turn-helix transcriptional regulator [Telmatospirillum siberiense]